MFRRSKKTSRSFDKFLEKAIALINKMFPPAELTLELQHKPTQIFQHYHHRIRGNWHRWEGLKNIFRYELNILCETGSKNREFNSPNSDYFLMITNVNTKGDLSQQYTQDLLNELEFLLKMLPPIPPPSQPQLKI